MERVHVSCLDIWPGSDAPEMVKALLWICEEIVMARTVRCLLHFASERERVQRKSREQCAQSWWKRHYLKLPGVNVNVKEKEKEERFARFLQVVNAFLEETVVWTGAPGEACDEHCGGGEGCNGRHVGLAVVGGGHQNQVVLSHNQLAVVWNHTDLCSWKPESTRGRASITLQRAESIRLFLEAQNNTVKMSNGETAFMVGAWGLAEHSCSADGIQVEFGQVLSNVDCHGHTAKWGFRLCLVQCELHVEDSRLVWNYGKEFVQSFNPCTCVSCFKNRQKKKKS